MKRILLFLIPILALSCEKEVIYPSIKIEAKNNDIIFYYAQESNISNTCMCNEMNVIFEYNPSESCYIKATSTDSLSITVFINRDTVLYKKGYQIVSFRQKL